VARLPLVVEGEAQRAAELANARIAGDSMVVLGRAREVIDGCSRIGQRKASCLGDPQRPTGDAYAAGLDHPC